MNNFRNYLSYCDDYILLAEEANSQEELNRLIIPVVILAWASIESFINNMLDDFANLPQGLFEIQERALLLEQKIKFLSNGSDAGKFKLEDTDYKRLEDKILFLLDKFGGKNKFLIKGQSLWQEFQKFKDIRDKIIHPRRNQQINLNLEKAKEYLETAKEIISLIAKKVWNKNISF